MNQFDQYKEHCVKAGDLLRSPMKGTVSNEAIAFNEGFDAAIKGFQSAIRAMSLPEAPLAIGDSFNERVLNVLGETWNLVSFPLDQPHKAQARTEIMRLMNEIVSMRNDPDIAALRQEGERKQELLITAIHEIGISAGVLNSDVNIDGSQALLFAKDIQESLTAMLKENEQLLAVLDALSKRCYIMSESHQAGGVLGARLIVGFNNIVDAGDAQSAIAALKGGAT